MKNQRKELIDKYHKHIAMNACWIIMITDAVNACWLIMITDAVNACWLIMITDAVNACWLIMITHNSECMLAYHDNRCWT
jgi:hypothetical protein